MQNNVVKKTLVFVVIALFIGIAVQPVISSNTIPMEEKTDVEPKDYLFQTILDIANNPEVKDLFEKAKNNGNLISYDYNSGSVFLKLLLRKPGILLSTLFTRPTISYKYLDFAYHQGCEMTDIIGEDKTLEIVESINITNPQILDSLTCIVMNNTELRNKIETLEIMNDELKSDKPFWNFPIICFISLMIGFFLTVMGNSFVYYLRENFPENSIFYKWLTYLFFIFEFSSAIFILITLFLNCFEQPPPP